MNPEIEAKFFITSPDAFRDHLIQTGFVCTKPERLMRRCNFQFAHEFSAGKKWARVRDEGDKVTLSVKEIRHGGADGTFESEITIDDFHAGCAVLTACGLHAMSLHENKRETWVAQGVVATIDTWPDLDPVLEVEADSVIRLDAVCLALQLNRDNAFYDPIDFIYARKYGVTPEEVLKLPKITFDEPPKFNCHSERE